MNQYIRDCEFSYHETLKFHSIQVFNEHICQNEQNFRIVHQYKEVFQKNLAIPKAIYQKQSTNFLL